MPLLWFMSPGIISVIATPQPASFFGSDGCNRCQFYVGWKKLDHRMEWDIGVSLRIMAINDIGRLDLVWSEDDAAAWLIYGHTF